MGSNVKNLQEKREQFVPRGVANGNMNVAAHAQGATVTDLEGNKWVDFAGAIGTLNVGHTHPKVTEAVKSQVDKFLHPGFNVIMYESYVNLAEKLCEITPGTFEKQALLSNSGAEAIENAVKVSRKYTGRQAVVSFEKGFHGRTNLTMGLTSKVKPYKLGFGPFASELYKAPFPDMSEKPEQMSDDEYLDFIIQQFDSFFISSVDPQTVACIIMEPVQGEGGFIIPPQKFVKYVSEFCNENGIVFVADEIQTGLGRTGTMFALEQFDVVPDVIAISKSLAAGLPLSGIVGRKEILNSANPGELGGTFAGNAVACAAALAVLEIIDEENLLDRSESIGQRMEEKLKGFREEHSFIGDIRRMGSMVAMEIIKKDSKNTPDKQKTTEIAKQANNNGLLLLTAGVNGNVVRFLSPLVITDAELEAGFDILENAFKGEE